MQVASTIKAIEAPTNPKIRIIAMKRMFNQAANKIVWQISKQNRGEFKNKA